MTELYHDLNYDDMAIIVKDIYDGVTNKDKVQVKYEQVKPASAKIVYSVMDNPKLGNIFVMFTNFNNATRKFDENPDPKDQLARWYHIKKDRLVYRKDVYSTELEQMKFKSENKSEVVKYYLFDDNPDNDDQIKSLIDDILKGEEKGSDFYFAQIYLIQYYLMNGQIEKAGNALGELELSFELNQNIPRNQKIYLMMVKAEYEVMKRI